MAWWGVSLTTHVFRVSPLLSSPAIAPFPSSNPTTTHHNILHQILLESEVSGPEALGDDSSPEAEALRWIAYEKVIVLIRFSYWHDHHSDSHFLAVLFEQRRINLGVQFQANSVN